MSCPVNPPTSPPLKTHRNPSLFPLPSFFPFFWSILGLKSFKGRQWDILQSISGVSGASGGLRSQNFDFLTKKKFLRKCSYLRNQTSYRLGSGVKTTVRPRATRMNFQIKCIHSSFQDRLCFIKPLYFPWDGPKVRFRPVLTVSDPPCQPGQIFLAQNAF